MKNNDFSKIIILILLNSFVYAQVIKQIVINSMPNHQFPEIQSIDFPEIQSIPSPATQKQESDTNMKLSEKNKVIEETSNTELCLEILWLIIQLMAELESVA